MGERIEITSEAIDIEGLVNSLDEKMKEAIDEKMKEALQRKCPTEPKIFRAPQSVRWSDRHAYEPKLVSIGPYHRAKSKDDFKAMEQLKWRLLRHYLSRTKHGIDWFLRKMKRSEEEARGYYYSEVIDIESDEFVKMLLLDGCFLVQIILAIVTPEQRPQELALLEDNMWFQNLLLRDLLLLENQLPYFIVKDLFDALEIKRDAFLAALEWFNCFLPAELKTRPSETLFEEPEPLFEEPKVLHLLHLFHKWILFDRKERRKTCCKEQSPGQLCSALSSLTNKTKDQLFKLIPCCSGASDPQQEERLPLVNETSDVSSGVIPSCSGAGSLKSFRSIPSVIGLREAGVEVKAEGDNFLNISFHNGVLRIPAITVDDNTSFILRNLIAFEQCYPSIGMDVTNYTLFMDDIINTPKDVELLCKAEIIDRKLGNDEEIAGLFNKMCKGVVFKVEGNHLDQVSEDVKKYCDSTWHKWHAILIHDYFSNPWASISVGAAVFLLVLTFFETVYSLLSYYQG